MPATRLRLVAAMTPTSTTELISVWSPPLNLAVLQEPQQQRLHAEAHFAYFVDERTVPPV